LVHETFTAAASVAVSAVDAFETAKFVGASGAALADSGVSEVTARRKATNR
jgi:hypothetical protein